MGRVVLERGLRDDTVVFGFCLEEKDDGSHWVTFRDVKYGIIFKISKEQYDQLDACNSPIRINIEEKRDDRKTLNIEQINQVIIEDFCNPTKKASIYYDMIIEW